MAGTVARVKWRVGRMGMVAATDASSWFSSNPHRGLGPGGVGVRIVKYDHILPLVQAVRVNVNPGRGRASLQVSHALSF